VSYLVFALLLFAVDFLEAPDGRPFLAAAFL
jgi:hypothetical protein